VMTIDAVAVVLRESLLVTFVFFVGSLESRISRLSV
jgi:hypothetical protein